jgi:hypothetical protein
MIRVAGDKVKTCAMNTAETTEVIAAVGFVAALQIHVNKTSVRRKT